MSADLKKKKKKKKPSFRSQGPSGSKQGLGAQRTAALQRDAAQLAEGVWRDAALAHPSPVPDGTPRGRSPLATRHFAPFGCWPNRCLPWRLAASGAASPAKVAGARERHWSRPTAISMKAAQLTCCLALLTWLPAARPDPLAKRGRSPEVCPRRLEEATAHGRSCLKQCDTDADCKSKRKRCLCDGVCGMSCIKPDLRCTQPLNPKHGSVRVTDDHFGAEAYYTCEGEYRLVGVDHRICQADSTWSGQEPQCLQAMFCGPPPRVPNAVHNAQTDQSQFELDTVLQYSCSLGYHTKGFAQAKCYFYNGTARWFGPDVECNPISCGEPGNVPNAYRVDEAFTFSSRVTYHCHEGFDLAGKSTRVCQGNGQWTGPPPTCRAVQCPAPEDLLNGRALYTYTTYNSVVSYECQYGHMLVGESTRKCGSDKQWTGTKPYCQEIDCGSPGILYNGRLEGDNTNLGSVVLFRCNDGMKFEGSALSTTCQLNGHWSQALPNCMAPCLSPDIAHGQANVTPGEQIPHGQQVVVKCDEKYEITYNATTATCTNGTWNTIPMCVPARCKTLPPRPRHGMVIAPKTEHGMRAKVKCKDGYVLQGSNVTTCQFGQWTGQMPYCQEIYCPFPGFIDHGKVLLVGNMGLYDYRPYVRKVVNNRQIMYECNKGYTLANGPPGATCIGGMWSPKQLPQCTPGKHPRLRWIRAIRENAVRRQVRRGLPVPSTIQRRNRRNPGRQPAPCDPIPDAPYMQVHILKVGDGNDTMPHGTEVEVRCNRGYGLNIGNKTAKCLRGKWRPRTPECVTLACKVPRAHNGVYHHQDLIVPEHSDIGHGEVVTYSCLPGYQLQGTDSMRCWFGDWAIEVFPDCTPAPCELPHIINGQYGGGYRAGLTIAHGSAVEYECEAEYVKTTLRPIRCHLGELKPRVPACRHTSVQVVPVLGKDGLPQEADVHFKQPGSDISVIDIRASFRRSCGPPERVQNALIYREGRLVTDNDHRFLDGTEVLFNCIVGITGEKTTWKIVCEDGTWVGRPHRCEGDAGSDHYEYLRNKSCVFRNTEPHLVTFYGDMRITDEMMEFPPGTELVSRCKDVGKYALLGSVRRRCVGGEWDGVKPTCFGLSQENDYALEKPPTILFRHQLGPIAQSNDGRLIVYPGTILHLECLWLRKFGTPRWEITHSYRKYPEGTPLWQLTHSSHKYPQGWTADPGRDSQLEYRLSIYHAQRDDSGIYACVTPKGHRHSVEIVVKAVHCPRIPERPGLHISNPSNKMNTRVAFSCRNGNALIGPEQATCLPSGNWSALPPACENVECSETLQVSDRALRVHVLSREVGGRATFSCAQGHGLRGPNEAVCESTGQWSLPLPHCEEVRCPLPESPSNGYIQGSGVYKAGDVVQFNCHQGFMMEGQPIIVCQDSGRWSGPIPKCVQACTYPGTTIGGTVSRVKFYYSIGETVTFDCAQGLELRGAHMLRCLPTGKWSNAIPSCVPAQG